jgi:hypothetical protein
LRKHVSIDALGRLLKSPVLKEKDIMKRLIAIVALLVSGAAAETVHLTQTDKTFDKTEQCVILKRSTDILHAENSDAESHGLKACRSCYADRKSNNRAWARAGR